MPEIDGSSKPPQITEMFQKFAIAFKTKTYEFFAEEDTDQPTSATEDSDPFSILDATDEFITGQKVVVIKPQHPSPNCNTEVTHALISSLFATISSVEASYLQLQTAHVPFDEDAIRVTDRAMVSHLQSLSEVKRSYRSFIQNSDCNLDFQIGSSLEAQVQENQNMLRTLETAVNRLQSEIDAKDDEVLLLKQNLESVNSYNSKLSKRIASLNSCSNLGTEVLLSVRVFDSMLRECCRALHVFSKLLIGLMKEAQWDVELAANSVYPGTVYMKKGHNRYAFMSYICLEMFQDFDSDNFGLTEEVLCRGSDPNLDKSDNIFMKQLIEHVSSNPIEVLSKNPSSDFSKFCEKKYGCIIHPTMESSMFSNLDQNEVVLNSWRSLKVFYESFVTMASSIWTLNKLAFSFSPPVEIFRVEKGVEFSMVYMEDITRKFDFKRKSRAKVGFTVVPGFKIGRTVVQSQVYLMRDKCTE